MMASGAGPWSAPARSWCPKALSTWDTSCATAVLLVFGAQRGLELLYSARNERLIRSRQPLAPQVSERIFRGIALVNLGLFTLPLLERAWRRRAPPAFIAGIGWIAALTAVALRLSVIA